MISAEEGKTKVNPITLAMILVIGFIGFEVGTLMEKGNGSDTVQQTVQMYQDRIMELQHQFAIDEVSGLRSDVAREVGVLQGQINEIKEQINKK